MPIKLYNTKTRQKDEFKPIDVNHVRIYSCGPTVYNYIHIGNARMLVVFDVLHRLLKHTYPKVTHAQNITDIDDKIMNAAKAQGVTAADIAEKYSNIFFHDRDAIGCSAPDFQPRATEYIPQQIKMIETLIKNGHAYAAEGHVLFDVPSYPEYGALSRNARDEQIAGARVEVAPYKKDPADFVLWKPSSDDQPGWDSPWGRGRPGWHLECSVMSTDILGENFDIHGGGQDLIFPHHENEIAQSCCAHKGSGFANYWVHNGFLQAKGEKMSKSLGNFFTVNELLEKFDGEVIRFVLLSAQYRQPLDFTMEQLEGSKKTLDRWYSAIQRLKGEMPAETHLPRDFIEALNDDLNTPAAFAELHRLYTEMNRADRGKKMGYKAQFIKCANFLGLLTKDPLVWLKGENDLIIERDFEAEKAAEDDGKMTNKKIDALVAERFEAKKAKNFARADEIRKLLTEHKIQLEDSPEGTTWKRG